MFFKKLLQKHTAGAQEAAPRNGEMMAVLWRAHRQPAAHDIPGCLPQQRAPGTHQLGCAGRRWEALPSARHVPYSLWRIACRVCATHPPSASPPAH
jgi:hypothetical protein